MVQKTHLLSCNQTELLRVGVHNRTVVGFNQEANLDKSAQSLAAKKFVKVLETIKNEGNLLVMESPDVLRNISEAQRANGNPIHFVYWVQKVEAMPKRARDADNTNIINNDSIILK